MSFKSVDDDEAGLGEGVTRGAAHGVAQVRVVVADADRSARRRGRPDATRRGSGAVGTAPRPSALATQTVLTSMSCRQRTTSLKPRSTVTRTVEGWVCRNRAAVLQLGAVPVEAVPAAVDHVQGRDAGTADAHQGEAGPARSLRGPPGRRHSPSRWPAPWGWVNVGWKPTEPEPPTARSKGGATAVLAPAAAPAPPRGRPRRGALKATDHQAPGQASRQHRPGHGRPGARNGRADLLDGAVASPTGPWPVAVRRDDEVEGAPIVVAQHAGKAVHRRGDALEHLAAFGEADALGQHGVGRPHRAVLAQTDAVGGDARRSPPTPGGWTGRRPRPRSKAVRRPPRRLGDDQGAAVVGDDRPVGERRCRRRPRNWCRRGRPGPARPWLMSLALSRPA